MSETAASSTWPADLDALIAAPEHHRLLLETDRVRVVETRIPPGERTAVHTHAWSGVQVVKSWSDFVRYGPEGEVALDTREVASAIPEALWTEPIGPHAVENVGERDLVVVAVELAPTS